MGKKTQPPCKAPGCIIIPRKDPVYCAEHKWMHNVDKAKHAGRAAIMQERSAHADARGKAWTTGGGTAVASTRSILAGLESNTEHSPEGAADAWHSTSALNSNLGRAEQTIVDGVAKDFGGGTYKDSVNNEYEVLPGKDRVKWDSEKLLDAIDAKVPDSATNADYVVSLRRLTTSTYRPHRMRSLMQGDLRRAFQSVHDGPSGLRPLDEETDDILADEFRKAEWKDIWAHACEAHKPDVPRITQRTGATTRMDALRDVQEARQLTSDALKDWESRAIFDKKPGQYVHDTFGSPIGKVTSGMEVLGPQHAIVNEALAQLPDRGSIRDAFNDVARIGGHKREMGKVDMDPDDYADTTPGRWRVKSLSG